MKQLDLVMIHPSSLPNHPSDFQVPGVEPAQQTGSSLAGALSRMDLLGSETKSSGYVLQATLMPLIVTICSARAGAGVSGEAGPPSHDGNCHEDDFVGAGGWGGY